MNNIQDRDTHNTKKPSHLTQDISRIFEQLDPQTVEQFSKIYQLWTLQHQIEALHQTITNLKQEIADNETQMRQVEPSPIALATLGQFQANGVNDIDLLEKMHERGDIWLDHTKQLLEHCEHLDIIGGDYNQWCEHALEGAYDWITSINETDPKHAPSQDTTQQSDETQSEVTEAQLLQKLMSEEGETDTAQSIEIPAEEIPLNDIQQFTEITPSTNEEIIVLSEQNIVVLSEETTLTSEEEYISPAEAFYTPPLVPVQETTEDVNEEIRQPIEPLPLMPIDEHLVNNEVISPDTLEENSLQQQIEDVSAESHLVESFPEETIVLVEELTTLPDDEEIASVSEDFQTSNEIEIPLDHSLSVPGEVVAQPEDEETASTSEDFRVSNETEIPLDHSLSVPEENTAQLEEFPKAEYIDTLEATQNHAFALVVQPTGQAVEQAKPQPGFLRRLLMKIRQLFMKIWPS